MQNITHKADKSFAKLVTGKQGSFGNPNFGKFGLKNWSVKPWWHEHRAVVRSRLWTPGRVQDAINKQDAGCKVKVAGSGWRVQSADQMTKLKE